MRKIFAILIGLMVSCSVFAKPTFTKMLNRYAVILEESDTVAVLNITVENKSKGQKVWFIDGIDNGNFTIYDYKNNMIAPYENVEYDWSNFKVTINDGE